VIRRILSGFLFGLPCYVIGAVGGGYLVYLLSANRHDLEMEATMTGAFVTGPLLAFLGFVVGAVRSRAGNQSH
jgi:hypothetical protein